MSLTFILVSYCQQSSGPEKFPIGGRLRAHGLWMLGGQQPRERIGQVKQDRKLVKEAQSQGSASSVRLHAYISHSQPS